MLAEAGGSIRQVYFPYSGVISLVVELHVGSMIETAMVGRDGVLNAVAALGGKVSLNKGIVQVAGSAGAIEVNRLRRLANEQSGSVRSSSDMSRSCLRNLSNRRRATPVTRSRPACAAGFSICATSPAATT